METREKARELFQIYLDILLDAESDKQEIDEAAKECALIAVDELIDQCWGYREIDLEKSCDYWKEVKQEIEKL
jgi:hypothetical protein